MSSNIEVNSGMEKYKKTRGKLARKTRQPLTLLTERCIQLILHHVSEM